MRPMTGKLAVIFLSLSYLISERTANVPLSTASQVYYQSLGKAKTTLFEKFVSNEGAQDRKMNI